MTKSTLSIIVVLLAILGSFSLAGSASAATTTEYNSLKTYSAWLKAKETTPVTDTVRSSYVSESKNKQVVARSKEAATYKKSVRTAKAKSKKSLAKKKSKLAKAYKKAYIKARTAAQKKSVNKAYKAKVKKAVLVSKKKLKKTKSTLRSRYAKIVKNIKVLYNSSLVSIAKMPKDTGVISNPTDPTNVIGRQIEAYREGVIGIETVVGIDELTVEAGTHIEGLVGSNGTVHINDSSTICGSLRIGPDSVSPVGNVSWDPDNPYTNGQGGGICSDTPIVKGSVVVPDVVLPDDISTNNSNSRLAAADPVDPSVWERGNVQFDAANRTLTVSYSNLKLQGTKPYLLCKLVLNGGAELIADSSDTKIFFDKPENCPGAGSDGNQLVVSNGASLSNTGSIPGFYLAGSDTIPTTATLSGGSNVKDLVLYSPKTNVTFSNGFRFDGAVVGKTLHVSGGGNVGSTFNGEDFGIPVIG